MIKDKDSPESNRNVVLQQLNPNLFRFKEFGFSPTSKSGLGTRSPVGPVNASSVSVCSVTNIRCPLSNYACDQGKRQAVFSSSIFSSLHLKALKRLKGEVAVEQTEGGSRTACCFPKGSILLAYSVPIRLLTHSLNAPRTNTKPTYFIFHFQQISLAY